MIMNNVKKEPSTPTKPNEVEKKENSELNKGDQGNKPQQNSPTPQNFQGVSRGGRGGFDNSRGRGGRFDGGRGRGRYDGGRGRGGGRVFNNQGGQEKAQSMEVAGNSQSSQGANDEQRDTQGGRGGFRGRGRGGRGGGGERREKIVHPPPQFTESGERMFTGRCRLFIGNLPQDMNQEGFEKMFQPFGQFQEAFINAPRGFGFIRMDTRENAVKAKKALDGEQMKGRFLRVRFASHPAAIKVKHLHQFVSNELLHEAFSVFGEIERAVVIIDDKGRTTGEGIVEFARKPGAVMALNRISEGVFLLGNSPRPVTAEALLENDEDDGLPEKFMPKNPDYMKEREQGARFASVNSFEYEFAHKWKEMYLMHTEAEENLKRQFAENVAKLEIEQANAQMEYQTQKLREDLARRQEELRKMEEQNQREMQMRQEMRRNQEESRRKIEEARKREEEESRLKMERYQQQQEERARQQQEMQLRELQEMRQMREELNQMRQQQRQLQGGRSDDMGMMGVRSDQGLMGNAPGDQLAGSQDQPGMMGPGPDMALRPDQRGIMGSRPDQVDMPAMKPPPAPPAVMLERRNNQDMGGRGNMDRSGRPSRFEQNSGFNQGGMGGVGNRGMDRRDHSDDFFDAKRQRRF